MSVYIRRRKRQKGYVYEVIVDYVRNGKRVRKSKALPHGTKKAEAEHIASRMQLEREFGDYIDKEPMTFSEYFDTKYLVNYVSVKELSPSTVKNYKQMVDVKNGIRDYFGDELLNNISTEKIQEYIKVQMEQCNRSPKTIKNHIGLLGGVLDRAMVDGYISKRENPVKYVVLPKWEQRKTEAYSLAEVKELMRRAENSGNLNVLAIIALSCLGGGLRRSEICGLKASKCFVEDCYEVKYIEISESVIQVEGGQAERKCKTKNSIRKVPIGDTLASIILRVKRQNAKKRLIAGEEFEGKDYLLLMDKPPFRPMKPNYIYSSFKKFLRRECSDIKELRLHDLRSTYASLAADLNWRETSLTSAMGHSDIATTQRFYIKAYDESLREDVGKLEEALSRIS